SSSCLLYSSCQVSHLFHPDPSSRRSPRAPRTRTAPRSINVQRLVLIPILGGRPSGLGTARVDVPNLLNNGSRGSVTRIDLGFVSRRLGRLGRRPVGRRLRHHIGLFG